MPDQLGISLAEATVPGSQLADACEADAQVQELVNLASRIEGLARNVGTHAAAVVIADQPLSEYVPLQRVTGKEAELLAGTCPFEYPTLSVALSKIPSSL